MLQVFVLKLVEVFVQVVEDLVQEAVRQHGLTRTLVQHNLDLVVFVVVVQTLLQEFREAPDGLGYEEQAQVHNKI